MVEIFGYELKKKKNEVDMENREKSFALPANDDGALVINTGAYYGTYVDLDGVVRNEAELINKYRDMSGQPEIVGAISDIVNESIVTDDKGKCIDINLDDLKQSQPIKKKIRDEFNYILKLLNFGNNSHEIFRKWYVDGRLFYHVVIDENAPSKGIQELRFINPTRIRKVREVQKTKDPKTGVEIVKGYQEYYVYNDRGVMATTTHMGQKIAVDSVININSGLMDTKQSMVLSHLHKAIRPLNQLRMIEDATVIYRLSRAPERRLFYIDVGNMPPQKADQYVRDQMVKYRNKIVYNADTGEIKDQRKYMAMLEDFWLPRREGNRTTEISTLPGGQNLGKIEDVEYFQKKLYAALDIPFSRASNIVAPSSSHGSSGVAGIGRTSEVSRDELKFSKFIQGLRNKFSVLFDEALRIQLVLKGICTNEEWDDFQEEIYYDYLKDNNWEEMKEQDLLTSRISLLGLVDPYIGVYFTPTWVKKKILKQTDEEIEQMQSELDEYNAQQAEIQQQQIEDEQSQHPVDVNGNPLPTDAQGNILGPQEVKPLDSSQLDQTQINRFNGIIPHDKPNTGIGTPKNSDQSERVIDQAKALGLEYYGFGRYGKKGKVTHMDVNDQLEQKKDYSRFIADAQ